MPKERSGPTASDRRTSSGSFNPRSVVAPSLDWADGESHLDPAPRPIVGWADRTTALDRELVDGSGGAPHMTEDDRHRVTRVDWTVVSGTAGSITGIAALLISWWTAVRSARSERPVEWVLDHVPEGDYGAMKVRIRCEGADALSFAAEGHYQNGEPDHPPGFWIEKRPILAVGDSVDMLFPPDTLDEGWVVLSWCHPRDRSHPIRAWFPVSPAGTAHDEFMRQTTTSPLVLWFRSHVLLSPVRPAGIPGRRTGWRDRRLIRQELRHRSVKRWRPKLPYQGTRDRYR